MSGHAEVAAPTPALDRVATRGAMGRNPHPAPELTAAPHLREDGRHTCELMPMGKGPGEQRHLVPTWTAMSRATDVHPMASLDTVRAKVN